MQRPFPAIGYPLLPAIALSLAVACLVTMVYDNAVLALVFGVLMGLGFLYFLATGAQRRAASDPA